MDDSLHDPDHVIIDLTEIIELGPRVPGAGAYAAPAEVEGVPLTDCMGSAVFVSGAQDLPAVHGCGSGGRGAGADADAPAADELGQDALPAAGPEKDEGAGAAGQLSPGPGEEGDPAACALGCQQKDGASAPGAEAEGVAAVALLQNAGGTGGEMSAVREAPLEGDIAPTLEQRLEAAEKTIMALCAEVSKLRQRIALSDYSSEVVFIHAANPALKQAHPGDAAMLPEHSSASLEEAVTRVEKLESRMDGLEESSMQSAADAAARIIREEIEKLKHSR